MMINIKNEYNISYDRKDFVMYIFTALPMWN